MPGRRSELRPEVLRTVKEMCEATQDGITSGAICARLHDRSSSAVMAMLRALTDDGLLLRMETGGRWHPLRYKVPLGAATVPKAMRCWDAPEELKPPKPIEWPDIGPPCNLAGLVEQVRK